MEMQAPLTSEMSTQELQEERVLWLKWLRSIHGDDPAGEERLKAIEKELEGRDTSPKLFEHYNGSYRFNLGKLRLGVHRLRHGKWDYMNIPANLYVSTPICFVMWVRYPFGEPPKENH